MSYNIDSSEYIKGSLKIQRKQARILVEKIKHLPEGCFLYELDLGSEQPDDELLPIVDFWWYGEGSGHAYHDHFKEVAKHLVGEATILFVWEGGDSQSAVQIKDGKVTDKKVKITAED